MITLSVWEACSPSCCSPPLTLGCKHSPPGLLLHLATSRFESKTLNDADLEGGVSPYSTALEGWHVT